MICCKPAHLPAAEVKALYDPKTYPFPADLGPYSVWWWTQMRMASDKVCSAGAPRPCTPREDPMGEMTRNLASGGFKIVDSHKVRAV